MANKPVLSEKQKARVEKLRALKDKHNLTTEGVHKVLAPGMGSINTIKGWLAEWKPMPGFVNDFLLYKLEGVPMKSRKEFDEVFEKNGRIFLGTIQKTQGETDRCPGCMGEVDVMACNMLNRAHGCFYKMGDTTKPLVWEEV